MLFIATVVFLPLLVLSQHEGVLDIQFPSIRVLAQDRGNISLQSGDGGNVHLTPGVNGSIFLEDVDLLEIIQIVKSLPPIWPEHESSDNLGVYRSGTQFSRHLKAEDPEGSVITYQVVAGNIPPGLSLTPTGNLSGILPETDSVYRFTVRAIDTHGKFSDLTFRMEIQANTPCKPEPCKNEGICHVKVAGDHFCDCIHPYGGKNCQLDCDKNPVGIDFKLKRIPDALMSAHNAYTTYLPYTGRLGDKKGWVGTDNSSWLQIDLGAPWTIHAVAQQSISSSYYTSVFNMKTSTDGNIFTVYTQLDDSPFPLSGTATAAVHITTLPKPVTARFFRFLPITSSTHPFFRLEMYGCPLLA